jgi:hypothetical protein
MRGRHGKQFLFNIFMHIIAFTAQLISPDISLTVSKNRQEA